MGVAAAAAITGAAAIIGTGVQLWANESAKDEARRESRRAEGLNIKFAGEETARQEKQFQRTMDFQEQGRTLNIAEKNRQNMMNWMIQNRAKVNQIMNYNKTRR